MKPELRRIKRLTEAINRSLFLIAGKLDYPRIVEGITKLADACHDYDGETEDWIYLNEFGEAAPDALIVGAFWHGTEWYGGQHCPVYAMLSSCGEVYNPGMECAPTEEDGSPEWGVYDALETMAEKHYAAKREKQTS